jgi:regulator of protease activity HflC (stomatin/prohibitin superfamily)
MIEKKDELRVEILKLMDEVVMSWGIHIENVNIKNIIVHPIL